MNKHVETSSEGSLFIGFINGEKCISRILEGSFRLCGSELSLNVLRYNYGNVIELSVKFSDIYLSEYPVSMDLDINGKPQGLLALMLLNLAGQFMDKAFNHYNYIAQGKAPRSEPPPERPSYPDSVSYVGRWEHDPVGSWAYPVFPRDLNEIPPYTVFLLVEQGDSYSVYLALSSGQLTGFIGPGPMLVNIYW